MPAPTSAPDRSGTVRTYDEARQRPLTVAVATACIVFVVVLGAIPLLAAVSEAVTPGSIPQLAPPPGAPPTVPVAAWAVVVVRALLVVVPLLLVRSVWRGARGPGALVGVLVLGAVLDLARGAVAGPVTVPLQLLGAALLLSGSARRWTRPAPRT